MSLPRPRPFATLPNYCIMLAVALAQLSLLMAQPRLPLAAPLSAAAPVQTPDFGRFPLSFVPNVGQTDAHVRFQAKGMGGTIFFTPEEVVLSLPATRPATPADDSGAVVRLHFEGANPNPTISAGALLPGVVHSMVGARDQWHMGIPTYDGVVYQQLYPGIDLRYEGTEGKLKSTYDLAPSANPSRLRWRYDGASAVGIERPSGDLRLALPGVNAPIVERAPIAWQDINGRRIPVAARYDIATDGSIGFALGSYDPAHPLTIDPTLEYSSYLGGNGVDDVYGIAVDAAGNAYITGSTNSASFPVAGTPIGNPTPVRPDVFIAKLNLTTNQIEFIDIVGGVNTDEGRAIAVDGTSVYVTGFTYSGDFPASGAFDNSYNGSADAFALSIDTSGALQYSTFLGGSLDDRGLGIAALGNSIFVTGRSASAGFGTPVIGGDDVFVVRVNKTVAGGGGLQSINRIGGLLNEEGNAIAVDGAGNAYVTGFTLSNATSPPGFPTATPFQPASGGGNDAFIVKLSSTTGGGAAPLAYSSYIGGSGDDNGRGIALDPTTPNVVYLTGDTSSSNFPGSLNGPFGNNDAFIFKLNLSTNVVGYSALLGGNNTDQGNSIVMDPTGNAYIAGTTSSGPLQANLNFPPPTTVTPGGLDAFVARYNASGALAFSSLIGGSGSDYGTGIAKATIAGRTKVYIGGYTNSANYPVTAGAAQPTISASFDGFIARIDNVPPLVDLNDNNPANGIDTSVTFTESATGPSTPVTLAPNLRVIDPDNAQLASVVVRFVPSVGAPPSCPASTPDGVAEGLTVTLSGAVTGGVYDSLTCSLTLTGPASLADFQATLRTVQYTNSSENPNTTARVVAFEANDGFDNNNPFAYATIAVVATNDPPVLSGTASFTPTQVLEDSPVTISGFGVSDLDAGTNNIKVTVAANNGTINFGAPAGVTVSGNGSASASITGPQASVSAALAAGFTYQGKANFNGTETINLTADDLGNTPAPAATDTDSFQFAVDPVNDAPTANDDTTTIQEDPVFAVPIDVVSNDNDDKDTLQLNANTPPAPFTPVSDLTVTTPPTNGTIVATDVAAGTLSYQPNAGFNGQDVFVYSVCDNGTPAPALCSTARVTITVSAENDPPIVSVPATQPVDVQEETTFAFTGANLISVTDVDLAEGTNTLKITLQVANGTLAVTPSGAANVTGSGTTTVVITGTPTDVNATLATLTYTGNLDYVGPDQIQATVDDLGNTGAPGAQTDTDVVQINVVNVEDAPVLAANNTLSVPEGGTGTITAAQLKTTDVDPDDTPDQLVYTLLTQPSLGTMTLNGVSVGTNGTFTQADINNGLVKYNHGGAESPPNGSDSFTFSVSDGQQAPTSPTEPPYTFNITITPVNDPPDADDDLYSLNEDTSLTVPAASGVLIDDLDVDGPPPLTAILVGPPANGTVTLNSDGSFTYTPKPNFFGVDVFIYQAQDGAGARSTDTQVRISVNPVNDVPVGNNDFYSTPEDTRLTVPAASGVLANDINPDGPPYTAILVTPPPAAQGTLTLNSDGSFVFNPALNFFGPVIFTYQGQDPPTPQQDKTAVVTVTIDVTPVNDPPVAGNDNYTTNEDTTLNVVAAEGVLANDSDVENDPFTAVLVTSTTKGTLTLNANGSFLYTPSQDFYGTDSFTYRARSSPTSESTPATVTIVVTPVNDPPIAVNDVAGVGFNLPTRIDVLANDSVGPDPNDILRVSDISVQAANGTAAVTNSGLDVTYTPNTDFKGADSFQYRVCDNGTPRLCATATVNVTVGQFRVNLPLMDKIPMPDLVGSFTLEPNSLAPFQPVVITAKVTNQGTAPASNFWVDFYINPLTPPTEPNLPWDEACNPDGCYGIAWFVSQTLQPGESITLTSTPDSYVPENTVWLGYFSPGTSDLYLFVDSWNRDATGATRDPNGAVVESNETNNRSEQHGTPVLVNRVPDNLPTAPRNIRRPQDLAPRSLDPRPQQ